MKKYRTVFIGNRPLILADLVKHPQIDLVQAFVIQGALIWENDCHGTPFTICDPKDASVVLDFLRAGNYDLNVYQPAAHRFYRLVHCQQTRFLA